nr:agamous-like MADS-box protein AGL86 [Ipomoea trifida]
MTMQAVVKKRKIERRKEALFKKAEEISMLCGSEIGIVIVSPTERDPIIWPEVEAMTNIFSAFMEVPEEERVKRMVFHKEYMRVKVNEGIGKMRRLEEEVERKEMNVLMKEVIAGRRNLTEMDARQLKGLYALADDKMVELEKRKQDFPATADDGGAARPPRRREWNLAPVAADSGGADGGGSYYVPQPPAPAAGELLPATWFVPNMAAPPPHGGGGGGGEGSYQQQMFFSLPTNNGGGANSASAYHHQVPNLNQDWIYNFFPGSI